MSDDALHAVANALTDDDGRTLVEALDGVGRRLRELGNGDAATAMGALEAHGQAVLDAAETLRREVAGVAEALETVAAALREGFAALADALRDTRARP